MGSLYNVFVNLKILIYLLSYMRKCFACTYAYVSLETRVLDGCEQSCEHWEPNLGPSQK